MHHLKFEMYEINVEYSFNFYFKILFVLLLKFEMLKSQHEKLEKQAISVQARLTNLQVCEQVKVLILLGNVPLASL